MTGGGSGTSELMFTATHECGNGFCVVYIVFNHNLLLSK